MKKGNPLRDVESKLRVTRPEKIAAGLRSVSSAMRNIYGKMGVIRGTRSLAKLNQKGGIDCQSCAWPDPDHRTAAEFCESGARALANEGTKSRCTPEFFAKHTVSVLRDWDEYSLNLQGRITHPMVLREGSDNYEPIEWDEAFGLIARELNSLQSPDEAVFYTSGRTSNEAAFLYQLFVRQFGTNNLPDCSNMCHESSSVALGETIGIGKATVRLDDFEKTDLIIVIGQNPGTNAPRMMSSLEDAKNAGAKMIAINPLPEAGLMNFVNPNPQHYGNPLTFPFALLANRPTQLADLHLPVRIGGDMAVLKGIMKAAVERDRLSPGTVLDHEFIAEKTSGFDEFLKSLDSVSWADIESESGLTRDAIREAAEMYISAERIITCWAMGITQHKKAVATIQEIVNLHLLRGQIGKPGAGLCPVRGHSNVQGDRTMGITERLPEAFREKLEDEFRFKVPAGDGLNTVQAILAMHDGRAKVFFAMGGNFFSSTPDTDYVEHALKSCRLTVQVITKLNRTALAAGNVSLILPCLGRSEIDMQASGEQFVTTESTMLNVQMSKGILKPASEHLRSESWIVCQLAKATLGTNSTVDWELMASNYDHIRDSISRVVSGFENFNQLIRQDGGFYLSNPPYEGWFNMPDKRARFTASELERTEIAEGRLLLTTIRAHSQFNTTIYDYRDRYRGIEGERRVIFMNSDDITERGLEAGRIVNLTSHFEDGERHADRFIVVPYPIPKGCAAAYFPEANPLVALGSVAERSFTPASKSIVISITPTGERAGRFDYDHMTGNGGADGN